MNRLRSVALAVAVVAVTAGFATAHAMPAASDAGIQQAQDVTGKVLPVGAGAANDEPSNPTPDNAGSPPSDTHGATVSAAAQSPTPDGFDNHGAYVSSIAKGWGQQTSAAHKNGGASGDNPPAAADQGLAHRP